MKSFDFDASATGVSDCEGEVDLMAMINGGEPSAPTVATASEPVDLAGPLPTFGDDDMMDTVGPEDDDESDDDELDDDDESEDSDSDDDDDSDLDAQIEFAKKEHTNTALLRLRSEAELKEIKKSEKYWLERVDKLQNRKLTRASEVPPIAKEPVDQPAEPQADENFDPAKPVVNEDAWRAIPTADIVADVAKLSQTKREALIDMYPTLGSLEEARAQASRAFKHFSAVLPDGIGKTLADEITNIMIEAIK